MILIATIATEYPEKSFKNYEKAFKSLGVKNIEKLDIKCRADAYVDENINLVKRCNILFFTLSFLFSAISVKPCIFS